MVLRHKLNKKLMSYGLHGEDGNGNWFPLWKMETETGSRFDFPRVKVCLYGFHRENGNGNRFPLRKMETGTGFRFVHFPRVRVCLWSIVKKIIPPKECG